MLSRHALGVAGTNVETSAPVAHVRAAVARSRGHALTRGIARERIGVGPGRAALWLARGARCVALARSIAVADAVG